MISCRRHGARLAFVTVHTPAGQAQVCFDHQQFDHQNPLDPFPSVKVQKGSFLKLWIHSAPHNGAIRQYVQRWEQGDAPADQPPPLDKPSKVQRRAVQWLSCPLCPPSSLKRYEASKGLRNHLRDLHPQSCPQETEQAVWLNQTVQLAEQAGKFRQKGFVGTRRNNPNAGGAVPTDMRWELCAAAEVTRTLCLTLTAHLPLFPLR